MSKITIPAKCAKCGSDKLRREEVVILGKLQLVRKGHRFDVYLCEECGYSEFFYRERTLG